MYTINPMGMGLGTKLKQSRVMDFLMGGFCICGHEFGMEKPNGFVPVQGENLSLHTFVQEEFAFVQVELVCCLSCALCFAISHVFRVSFVCSFALVYVFRGSL
jgi:hypothetical protein